MFERSSQQKNSSPGKADVYNFFFYFKWNVYHLYVSSVQI